MNDGLNIFGYIHIIPSFAGRDYPPITPRNRVVDTAREMLAASMLGSPALAITHIGWGAGTTPTKGSHPEESWAGPMEDLRQVKSVNVIRVGTQLHVRWSMSKAECNDFVPTEWALLMENEDETLGLFSRSILPGLTKTSLLSYRGVWVIDFGGNYYE